MLELSSRRFTPFSYVRAHGCSHHIKRTVELQRYLNLAFIFVCGTTVWEEKSCVKCNRYSVTDARLNSCGTSVFIRVINSYTLKGFSNPVYVNYLKNSTDMLRWISTVA